MAILAHMTIIVYQDRGLWDRIAQSYNWRKTDQKTARHLEGLKTSYVERDDWETIDYWKTNNMQEGADVVTLSRVPLAPVESALSLPAKSTRLILLTYLKIKYRLGINRERKKTKRKLYITCTEL